MGNNVKMPVLFIGHGSPMNAISDNAFTQSLKSLGKNILQKPEAIMVISAHWLTEGSFVATASSPETIYDFYGFPDELYQVKYPASGSPEFAEEVKNILPEIKGNAEWGLDHGAWSILKHLFPEADIPVFQFSIYYDKPMQYHFDLAKNFKSLRDMGVLIIGSGNIVHNLRLVKWDEKYAYDWAIEFDSMVKDKIDKRDFQGLVKFETMGKSAVLSIPTVDHYVPLLYSLALAEDEEPIVYTHEEIVLGSMSMRCLRIG